MGGVSLEPLAMKWQPQSEELLPTVQEVCRFIAEAANRIRFMQRELQELEKDAKTARLWAARIIEQRLAEEIGRRVCMERNSPKVQESQA